MKIKMSMKDISIAACGAFAAIVIGINWWGPAFAGSALQGGPPDAVMQKSTTAYQTWNGASAMYAEQMSALYNAYDALRAENAQLKDDLAKAKAAPPPAPAPMSTPSNTPLVVPAPNNSGNTNNISPGQKP